MSFRHMQRQKTRVDCARVFWTGYSEWLMRFLLIRIAKRENWSRTGSVDGKGIFYWRARRARAVAIYKQRFGHVPIVYEQAQLPNQLPSWGIELAKPSPSWPASEA
jgi:hypothetical protein